MNKQKRKRELQDRRRRRSRRKMTGTPERPRLSVFRSLTNVYGQLIDDLDGRTLLSLSTLNAEVRSETGASAGNVRAAAILGRRLAEAARQKGIKAVVFDRGPYRYHGRIKALADAAREAGLSF